MNNNEPNINNNENNEIPLDSFNLGELNESQVVDSLFPEESEEQLETPTNEPSLVRDIEQPSLNTTMFNEKLEIPELNIAIKEKKPRKKGGLLVILLLLIILGVGGYLFISYTDIGKGLFDSIFLKNNSRKVFDDALSKASNYLSFFNENDYYSGTISLNGAVSIDANFEANKVSNYYKTDLSLLYGDNGPFAISFYNINEKTYFYSDEIFDQYVDISSLVSKYFDKINAYSKIVEGIKQAKEEDFTTNKEDGLSIYTYQVSIGDRYEISIYTNEQKSINKIVLSLDYKIVIEDIEEDSFNISVLINESNYKGRVSYKDNSLDIALSNEDDAININASFKDSEAITPLEIPNDKLVIYDNLDEIDQLWISLNVSNNETINALKNMFGLY